MSQRLTPLCGFFGACVLLVGCVLPICFYREPSGAGDFCLNHFISELGRPCSSPQAAVFNAGIVLGGMLIAAFMFGLGKYYRTKLGCAAATAGVLGGLACCGTGLVPINHLMPHLAIAVIFFYGAWIAFALFGVVFARDQQNKLPRWLGLPSIATVLCFATLLASPLFAGHIAIESIQTRRFTRPVIWPAAWLEWLVLASILLWLVLVAGCLLRSPLSSNRIVPQA